MAPVVLGADGVVMLILGAVGEGVCTLGVPERKEGVEVAEDAGVVEGVVEGVLWGTLPPNKGCPLAFLLPAAGWDLGGVDSSTSSSSLEDGVAGRVRLLRWHGAACSVI